MKTAQEFLQEKGVPYTFLGDHSIQGVSVIDLMQEYSDYVMLNSTKAIAIDWLPMVKHNYGRFNELAKENKLLMKFDNGSIVKQGEKEPFAIMTHFTEQA